MGENRIGMEYTYMSSASASLSIRITGVDVSIESGVHIENLMNGTSVAVSNRSDTTRLTISAKPNDNLDYSKLVPGDYMLLTPGQYSSLKAYGTPWPGATNDGLRKERDSLALIAQEHGEIISRQQAEIEALKARTPIIYEALF